MQKILVVEDSKSIQMLIGKILTDLRVELTFALTGEETKKILKTQRFDLMLLDLVLPDTMGYELLQQIDSEKVSNNVIIMTSINDTKDLMKGFSLGAVDYIRKPFNYDEFRVRIKSNLDAVRTTKQLEQETAKLNHFFNNSNLLIQSTDHNGVIREVNKTWLAKMGYSISEIEKGLNFRDIIDPEELDHCLTIFQSIMEGKKVDTFKTSFIAKDKSKILVEGNVIAYTHTNEVLLKGYLEILLKVKNSIGKLDSFLNQWNIVDLPCSLLILMET